MSTFDQLKRSLIARLPNHPDGARMAVVINEVLQVAQKFEERRRELELANHLTAHGRREALKKELVERHARDLRDASAPIAEARERLRTMRQGLKPRPSVDRSDFVGALERQEMRATIAEMPDAERTQFVLTTKDARIVEAVLGQPAVVSGLPDDVYEKLESGYQQRVYGKELQEIRDLETVVAEAEAAAAT